MLSGLRHPAWLLVLPFRHGKLVFCFVLKTIRTGAMRVIHISVKTEETQKLGIMFVVCCSICARKL